MCLAFQLIHENKVMHKNVQTEHFLIEPETDLIKVIGFSKLREMKHDNSIGSTRDADSSYTAPECVDGQNYTRAADVWGIGLVLFQMASGGTAPYSIDFDAEKISQWVAANGHKDTAVIGEKSEMFMNLMDGIFKIVPEERFSIGQIINEFLSEQVKAYINGEKFKTAFMITRKLMSIMNEEKNELHKVNMTDAAAEKEYEEYKLSVFK